MAPVNTAYCDDCKRMREYRIETRTETFDVKGETITIDASVAVCGACGLELGIAEVDDVALVAAYGVYRARRGLLQPEEIKAIRSMYGLGQKAFARLLGWGEITLHRYESGALQSASHDEMLRMVQDPGNVQRLLSRNGDQLTEEQRETLRRRLGQLSSEHEGLVAREERAVYRSGGGVRKLGEMMVFFASTADCWRTKLNKLLFYADFLAFRRHGTAISGCRYVHMQYGPVPADFYSLQASLVEDTSLAESRTTDDDCEGTIFTASRPADLALFSGDEIAILDEVARTFEGWGAGRISDFSHQEPAWLETKDRETIPYDFAARLQLQ